jgi:uncharacterized OsmC-like protein
VATFAEVELPGTVGRGRLAQWCRKAGRKSQTKIRALGFRVAAGFGPALAAGMVKLSAVYEGDLHTVATHGPSGRTLETDAPVDNQGRGETFSPTDLVAAALGSCMLTIMGMAARRLGLELKGARVEVTKEMTPQPPRRIEKLITEIWIPLPRSADPTGQLERAALTCPVHRSLLAEIEKPVVFHWQE